MSGWTGRLLKEWTILAKISKGSECLRRRCILKLFLNGFHRHHSPSLTEVHRRICRTSSLERCGIRAPLPANGNFGKRLHYRARAVQS